MFALQALTRAGGRPARPLNTLGWSALALLAADPGNLTDVGFQLSFVSVAALVTWGDRLARAASGLRLIPRCLLASIAVSLATAAATAPILLFRFQRLHPLGPLWNLLAFPLTVIPLVGGLCSIALGVIHPALGSPVAWLVGPACSALLAPLSWGAGVPGSTVTLPPPPGALVLAAYALLGAGLLPPCRRTRALTALIIAGALDCCVATRTDAPEIWTFDVGAGDAALLRFPQTASFLVDAGGPGASLVRAILSAGAPVVPSVFVTHPHEDHVRGIETVARMLGVRSAWGPRGWCSDPAGATAASIARTLGPCGKDASRGLRLTFGQSRPGEDASGGDRGDSVRVDVLLPLPLDSVVSPSATNDASLVLRIAYRGKRILFLGDLEETGVALLLAIERDLRAQVLVAPHHGRLNRLWPELVARVSPEHVMISGRGDGGAAQLARWLELRGIRTFGTWTAGAIRTRWTPSGWLPELARRAR